jgi:hypothetical protein
MSAISLFGDDETQNKNSITSTKLSVFGLEEWAESANQKQLKQQDCTRIINPTPAQDLKNDLLDELRETEKDDIPCVTLEQINYFRTVGSLGEFYSSIVEPFRRRQLARGAVAAGTLTNERQAVRCFDQFDKRSRPPKWPIGEAWNGRPVGYLASKYLRDWLSYRLANGTDRGKLSQGSLPKRWFHLRFVINWSVRLKILDEPLSLSVEEIIDSHHAEHNSDELDLDLIPNALTEQQLQSVYLKLASDIELQTAWVLASFCGPRTGDLFSLRWQKNIRLTTDPPDLIYLAQKTKRKKRRIWCPLSPLVVKHLQKLARNQCHLDEPMGLVFPGLTDGQRKDPEDGERSRARNRKIKQIMLLAGIPPTADTERPWQLLRSTANSRLNDCENQAGNRATHGKDASVQGQFYTDYKDTLLRGVMALDRKRSDTGMFGFEMG